MAYTIPTLDDVHGFLLAMGSYLMPDKDWSDGSFPWLWTRTLAAGVTGNDAHIAADENDLMPDTAAGAMQDRWANIVGRPRKAATPSRGSDALRVSGAPGTVVPSDDTGVLVSPSGLSYQITASDIVGAGGYVDVDIVSIDAGANTMLTANTNLTFVATPVGLQETAVLQIDLENGADDEADGALSLRIVDRFQNPPLGGAQNDYATWATEVTDVAAAFVYPLRAGVGTVDIAALHAGNGTDRILTPAEVAIVQAYIDTKRPVSVKDCRMLTVNGVPTDVEYTYIPDGAISHAPDWDDTTPGTVLAWTAGTRTMQFTGGSRPATLKAGDRIITKPAAGGGSGAQRVVESLSGADSVVLEVDTTGAGDPTATDTIYAGGPLADPIRNAIVALFAGFGTANPDGNRYGTWEGNLRPSAVGRVATAVTGVLDGTVVTPSATVAANDPAFPDDGTIELLVPRLVLVRAQH